MSRPNNLCNQIFTTIKRCCLAQISLAQVVCLTLSFSTADASNRGLTSETSIDYTMHRLATEYNDPSAQYLVGRNYLKGKSVEKNVKEAIKWFEMAAKQNHIRAQYQLGKLYLYGKEIKTNLNFAFYFLSKAAEKNHLESQYELANFYLKGNANKRQYAKASDWYRRAAKRGHVRSMFELGKLLNEGLGVKQNRSEARRWISDAAESGLLEATNYLNKMEDVVEPAPDHNNNKQFATVVDDEIGDPTSPDDFALIRGSPEKESIDHYLLGIAYLTGDGKKKNVFEAAQHFKMAANQGHGKAQYQLAKLYEQGIGVEQNSKLYQKWLNKAASAGVISAQRDLDLKSTDSKPSQPSKTSSDRDAEAQFRLGIKHLTGDNATKDPGKASILFIKAAKQNHARAQYQLGLMYEKAIGFDRNIKKAREWYQKAADAGLPEAQDALLAFTDKKNQERVVSIKARKKTTDPLDAQLIDKKSSPINTFVMKAKKGDRAAQFEVGIGFLSGENGFEKNIKKGIDWLKTAATNHHVKAGTTLGLLYYEGREVERDYPTAAKWLEKSAMDGDADAQYTLGNIYRQGLGVAKNNTTAIKWYRKAANQGHKAARKQLGGCRIC